MDASSEKPKHLPPQIWIPVLTSAICLAVVFVLWGLNREAPYQASPSTSLGTTDPTAGWKTYRNEKYGFEVKYPKEYQMTDNNSMIYITNFPYDTEKQYFHFPSQSSVRIYIEAGKNDSNSLGSEKKNYELDDIKAVKTITKEGDLINIEESRVYASGIESGVKVVAVRGVYYYYLQVNPYSPDTVQLFNQILSTFKFTK